MDLTETNHKQANQIDRLQNEGDHQRKTISDQEYQIKNLENDKAKQQIRNDDLNNENRNLVNKLSAKEDNLNQTIRALEESKKQVQKLQVS